MERTRVEAAKKRHRRVRRRVAGMPQRPRLCVHRSLKHIYVQIVDDLAGRALCQATTNTKAGKAGGGASHCNKAAAKRLGEAVGKMALDKGIARVVFDRGGYRYHGVVRELAEAIRAAGVKF